MKVFLFVRSLEANDVKPYRSNKCTYFRIRKTFADFPFTSTVEAFKLPNLLQMKVLSSALKVTLSFLLELFDANDFQSNNSEECNYKIESFVTKINLPNFQLTAHGIVHLT